MNGEKQKKEHKCNIYIINDIYTEFRAATAENRTMYFFFSLCNVFLSLHYYRVLFVSFSFE